MNNTEQKAINVLLQHALKNNLINKEDYFYCANKIIDILKIDQFAVLEVNDMDWFEALKNLSKHAIDNDLIEDTFLTVLKLEAKIMDVLTPRPSEINHIFHDLYANDKIVATDYFYNLCVSNNYVQSKVVANNITWKSDTEYGKLDITINISKPEKDPKEIAKLLTLKESGYPSCQLCVENLGYSGGESKESRYNLRTVDIKLNNEDWQLQFSPYQYYNQHAIVLNTNHRPMIINKETIKKLAEFTDLFPHYLVGSNSDIPIVGGSILNHDHFQAGAYQFPMEIAKEVCKIKSANFPNVQMTILKWPLSVVKLTSSSKEEIINFVDNIRVKWEQYQNIELEIINFTNDTRHNAITPVCRKINNEYCFYVILRNNRTTDEHPMGIFHPHDHLHHIKKENIGLIEAMGMAILPARLDHQLKVIEKCLLTNSELPEELAIHKQWFNTLKVIDENEVTNYLKSEVAIKFKEVLECSGVFKQDEQGQDAFLEFCKTL